jgi:hypothetical protein
VVARVTSSATPTGEFMGVPASGKRHTIGEIDLFRIADGKVVEHWHQHDTLGLMEQLGALPPRAAVEPSGHLGAPGAPDPRRPSGQPLPGPRILGDAWPSSRPAPSPSSSPMSKAPPDS